MSLFSKFIATVKGTDGFSAADWAELERELLLSDLGPSLSRGLIEEAKKVKSEGAELALRQILLSQLSTSDPASVAFDAVTAAKSKNVDFLIIDTA